MNVKEMYQQLVNQGMAPKDAAKQVQAKTGVSVVSGKPINRQLYDNFSKKDHKVIGQYGSN